MGYIICKIHGGNVTGFISEYHANKIIKKEKTVDSEILNIEVFDKEKLFNGHYIIDPDLAIEIGIKELKINVESEFKKYEMMLEKMSPICPKCIENYLKEK